MSGRYSCAKHNSTYGYKDADGEWHCWACYRENEYFSPKGEILNTYTSKGIEARLIIIGTHSVLLQIWDISNVERKRLIDSLTYNYMSQAMREWATLVSKIENEKIVSGQTRINFDELLTRRNR